MTLKNDRFLRALAKKPIDRTPFWMMRQAGRYLPEYRALRAQAGSFMQLCKTPALSCEATLQPLRRFPLDAAILFSDILTIPDAMGLGLSFHEGEGPQFEHPIRHRADIQKLPDSLDPEDELKYVMDAIRLINTSLEDSVPLIGFSGSPWTLATYMIEGRSSKQFERIKALMYTDPKCLHLLLEKITQAVINYLNAQIHAGVHAVQIFDTWGGILSTSSYQTFSLYYMQKIIAGLTRHYQGRYIPVILFTKGGGAWLNDMVNTGADCLGLDWTTSLATARANVGDRVALQGNLDPCVLYATPEVIRTEVAKVLQEFGNGSGHIFNLGHGIHPQIDPENVSALVQAVHEFSADYHRQE